ncbi:MAG: glycosyltransferase family 2 protein [Pedobacter sp.]
MLISVCIPTYSRLNYLQIAIESILRQTYQDYEICVSLDPKMTGPDPAIHVWCTQLALVNPRVRYHVNEQNVGLAGNWNVLAQIAKGDYAIIIGDDDTLEIDYLERVVANLANSNADVVFTDQNFIGPDGEILPELSTQMSIEYYRSQLPIGILADPIESVLKNSIPMSSSIIRRTLLLKHPFDPILNTPELEVFLKIAVSGGVFEYIDSRCANYRVHPGSETSGGLKLHYMLNNIIPVQVPEKYEALKFDLIAHKIIPAINNCLREGNTELAQSLLNSPYYPSKKGHIKVIQNLLLYFPTRLVKSLI